MLSLGMMQVGQHYTRALSSLESNALRREVLLEVHDS